MNYTFVDSTGEIRVQLTAADPYVDDSGQRVIPEIVLLNTPDGCTLVEGAPPSPTSWWNGKWNERPAQPQSYDTWDAVHKAWVDARPLADVKAQQWQAVSSARDAALFGVLTWSGSVFQVDSDSQQRIQGGVMLAQLAQSAGNTTWTIDWTLADNTVRTLSIADMVNLGLAVGSFFQTNWNKATTLRAQIEAAQTAADVMAIVWI